MEFAAEALEGDPSVRAVTGWLLDFFQVCFVAYFLPNCEHSQGKLFVRAPKWRRKKPMV